MAETVDGKGMDMPKEKTPQASVEGSPATGGPGRESSGKTWISTEGPNPGK